MLLFGQGKCEFLEFFDDFYFFFSKISKNFLVLLNFGVIMTMISSNIQITKICTSFRMIKTQQTENNDRRS